MEIPGHVLGWRRIVGQTHRKDGLIVLRLGLALAIVGYIFVHSPERRPAGASAESSRWLEQLGGHLAQTAMRSEAAAELVRRQMPVPARDAALSQAVGR